MGTHPSKPPLLLHTDRSHCALCSALLSFPHCPLPALPHTHYGSQWGAPAKSMRYRDAVGACAQCRLLHSRWKGQLGRQRRGGADGMVSVPTSLCCVLPYIWLLLLD